MTYNTFFDSTIIPPDFILEQLSDREKEFIAIKWIIKTECEGLIAQRGSLANKLRELSNKGFVVGYIDRKGKRKQANINLSDRTIQRWYYEVVKS